MAPPLYRTTDIPNFSQHLFLLQDTEVPTTEQNAVYQLSAICVCAVLSSGHISQRLFYRNLFSFAFFSRTAMSTDRIISFRTTILPPQGRANSRLCSTNLRMVSQVRRKKQKPAQETEHEEHRERRKDLERYPAVISEFSQSASVLPHPIQRFSREQRKKLK